MSLHIPFVNHHLPEIQPLIDTIIRSDLNDKAVAVPPGFVDTPIFKILNPWFAGDSRISSYMHRAKQGKRFPAKDLIVQSAVFGPLRFANYIADVAHILNRTDDLKGKIQ
jgi:hypothetical protein